MTLHNQMPDRRHTTARSGRRWLIAGALLGTLGLVSLPGCTSDGEATGGTGGTGGTVDIATGAVTLVTYSSFVLDDRVRAQLEQSMGLKITVAAVGDAVEALNAAILTAGHPEGDVFFGIDNTLVDRALSTDLFEVSDPAEASAIPEPYRLDASGRLYAVDTGPVCVDYDAAWFTGHGIAPPASITDLIDPTYKDLLVVENPATSSPGLVFVAAVRTELGDGAPAYWEQLKANGVEVAGSWDDAWQQRYTVNGGDRPLVLSYGSSPPAEVFYSEGKLTTPSSRVVAGTCAEQVELAGVMRGAAHPGAGRALLNAMLSRTWQEALPLTNFVYPIRTDAELPELFTKFAPRREDTIRLDPSVGRSSDAWLAEWRGVME